MDMQPVVDQLLCDPRLDQLRDSYRQGEEGEKLEPPWSTESAILPTVSEMLSFYFLSVSLWKSPEQTATVGSFLWDEAPCLSETLKQWRENPRDL